MSPNEAGMFVFVGLVIGFMIGYLWRWSKEVFE